MSDILIITDNSGKLFNKYVGPGEEHKREGVNINLIKRLFEEYGHCVKVIRVSEMDFSLDYKGHYVLYTSSEARGGVYKDYIENILLYLEKSGAYLIPSIYYFRAHHNKSFQEMMRKRFSETDLKCPRSIIIDDFDSLYDHLNSINYPVVLKMSKGSGSEGVVKVAGKKELLSYAKKMMLIRYRDYHDIKRFWTNSIKVVWLLKEGIKKILGLPTTFLQKDTIYCNSIIIQDFIKNLSGDYKILFFENHYYVLYRENRKDDFRASGSGRFIFPESVEEIEDILDFAEKATAEIAMPCISMDIARSEEGCVLIEYQCVYFGNYTMQYSKWYYARERGIWKQHEAEYEIEEEYCRAVHQYIAKRNIAVKNA